MPIEAVARGEIDFNLNYSINYVSAIASGKPVTLLAGVHVGCYELFAREGIRTIADLKGKSVGVGAVGSVGSLLVTMMAAHVGLDPAKDIDWVTDPKVKPIELFVRGKVDAFLGFPPEPQDLRARQIGNVIVNSALDRPWSSIFVAWWCGNPEYVQQPSGRHQARVARHPQGNRPLRHRSGARRAPACRWRLHAALRLCAPGAARVHYDRWREYDPEDTIRFYALRLRDVGFIKSTPQKIIADGTDWRFLNELKRELKA